MLHWAPPNFLIGYAHEVSRNGITTFEGFGIGSLYVMNLIIYTATWYSVIAGVIEAARKRLDALFYFGCFSIYMTYFFRFGI